MSLIKSLAKEIRYWLLYIRYYHKFQSVGKHTVMFKPLRIMGGKNIIVGDYVYILKGLRLEAIEHFNSQVFHPRIEIGDNVEIGQNCQISCTNRVVMEDDVTLGPNVMINDTSHGHSLRDIPINKQDLKGAPIRLKKGCLIGYGATILPGVTIGKNSVIGAGCVIAKDVPDYTIVYNKSNLLMKSMDE